MSEETPARRVTSQKEKEKGLEKRKGKQKRQGEK